MDAPRAPQRATAPAAEPAAPPARDDAGADDADAATTATTLSPLVLSLVLRHGLAGDVAALCAAACVARDWRDAVKDQALWATRLDCTGEAASYMLTDARLLSLVARAGREVQRVERSNAAQLTDAGLAAALAPQRALKQLAVDSCTHLTAAGVAAALSGKRLEALWVHGVSTVDNDDEPAAQAALAQLRSVAATLDVSAVCGARARYGAAACLQLCGPALPAGSADATPTRGGACSACGVNVRRRAAGVRGLRGGFLPRLRQRCG
jgi:hypothetical protein